MLPRRFLLVFLAIILTACSMPSVSANPTLQPPTAAEPTASLPTAIPSLTVEQISNAEVNINGNSPDATSPRTIRLVNGQFEPVTDRADPSYVRVSMGEPVARGDLNGDGTEDAAMIIGENYGGTGTFVSVVVLLNQNGQPVFGGSSVVDDRPMISSLNIQNGEIVLTGNIHGPNDPACCPAQPVSETFRLWGGKLIQSGHTSKIPDGTERVIAIQSPAQGSEISGPFTINGSVTIAPFENNLAYSVFAEGRPDPVMQSAIMVSASEMGGPGTFSLPLDLTASGIKGKIRIEISDISAADGSSLAIATLFATIK